MPMIDFRGRGMWPAVAVLGGLLLAQQAAASCSLSSSSFVPQDVQMDMGQVVILPGTPVGGVIKQLSVPINGRDSVASCDRFGGRATGEYVNAPQRRAVAGFANVFETGVAGVGIRLYRDAGTIQSYYPHSINLGGNTNISLSGGMFRVELIKTAAQTGSGVIAPNGRFSTYYYDGNGPSRPVLTSTFKASGTTVVSATCEVQAGSRNIPVDFGSVPNTAFTGVGSRAVNRDFEIRLDCQGSNLAQYQSKVGIRLDADADAANMPGVLKLSAVANSASRIGIEVVRRDGSSEREVRFGQPISVGATTMGGSTLTLPLRARYVQTLAGTVGAGVANGQATFTIQYD
ncbi:type 1 fimbrial protein [Bacillus subtilis subsp. subtilis]|nr:type 1 fimbrial protein [Bacillus subtilis subsp. subtilis]